MATRRLAACAFVLGLCSSPLSAHAQTTPAPPAAAPAPAWEDSPAGAPAPAPAPAGCRDNADCPSGQVCAGAQCALPTAPAPAPSSAYPAQPPMLVETEPPPPSQGRRSTGLMVGGIVCTSIGGVALLVGAILVSGASSEDTTVCENGACRPANQEDRDSMNAAGVVGVVVGVGLLGAGIPMIVVGAKRRAADLGSPHVGFRLGPRGANLQLRF